MAIPNISEAEAFYSYLGYELSNGGKYKSLEALLDDWRQQCEIEATVAAVEEGYADCEAGRMVPLRDLLPSAKGGKDVSQ